MHPEIRNFPSLYFYKNSLIDGPNIQRYNQPFYKSGVFGPYVIYNIQEGRESRDDISFENSFEAQFIISLLIEFSKSYSNLNVFFVLKKKKITTLFFFPTIQTSIGILTPYRAQRKRLEEEAKKAQFPSHFYKRIEFKTIDGSQGQEKDIIIFSCVRSSDHKSVGFLQDLRRLNVAITRAKYSNIIVGSVSTLVKSEVWRSLLENAKQRNCLVDVPCVRKFDFQRKLQLIEDDNLFDPPTKKLHRD